MAKKKKEAEKAKAREVLRYMGRQKKSTYEEEASASIPRHRRTGFTGRKAPKGLGKALVVKKVFDAKRDEGDYKFDMTRQIAMRLSQKDVAAVEAGKKGAKTKPPVEYLMAARKARREMASARARYDAKKITFGQYNAVLTKYGYGPRQSSVTPHQPNFPFGAEGEPGDYHYKGDPQPGYDRKKSAARLKKKAARARALRRKR